jgi:hypothetical protein
MNDLLVIMYYSQPQWMMHSYLRQLADAGIDIHDEHTPEFNGVCTMEWTAKFRRKMATRFLDYDKIIFTCAFDMMFFGSKEDVLRKIPDEGVLIGAERNCYPDSSLANRFPISNHHCWPTPWHWVNGGAMAGRPENILKWLDGVEASPQYNPDALDQGVMNELWAAGSSLIPLDDRTELFYCLYKDQGDLDFDKGLPVNTLCNTRPNFLHFSGRWDTAETLKRLERSLA